MDVIVKIAQLLVSLSILIVLHELGHFTLARIFKVRVEKFYLFFDAGFSLLEKRSEIPNMGSDGSRLEGM